MTKVCTRCLQEKTLDNFYRRSASNDGLDYSCKKCSWDKTRLSRLKKEQKYSEYNKQYSKQYRIDNKDRLRILNIQWRKSHRQICNHRSNLYHHKNSEKIRIQRLVWRSKHKDELNAKERMRYNTKRKNDLIWKLCRNVSNMIRSKIRLHSNAKISSVWTRLPYTPYELKEHLESLFESWMSWENYGRASTERKTWQIDHITPQFKLPYDSLDHPNFLISWSLENLRPIDSMENIIRGQEYILCYTNNN